MKHLKILLILMAAATALSARTKSKPIDWIRVETNSILERNYNLTLLSGNPLYAIDLLTLTISMFNLNDKGTIVIREWLPRSVFQKGLPQIQPFFKYTTFKITNRTLINSWTMKYQADQFGTDDNRTLTLIDYNHGPSPEVRQYAIEVIITSTSSEVRYRGNHKRIAYPSSLSSGN